MMDVHWPEGRPITIKQRYEYAQSGGQSLHHRDTETRRRSGAATRRQTSRIDGALTTAYCASANATIVLPALPDFSSSPTKSFCSALASSSSISHDSTSSGLAPW